MGIIEVDIFSEDVDSPEHDVAASFKDLLEEVAEQYKCHLTHFDVQRGMVSFSFDDDELTAKILKILRTGEGDISKSPE
ncbi:MAG: hypothetical protein A2Z39_02955 [Deltaproteobacteria bacterium RBG_19FT_COMBO_46_9]|jgi:hypothetical protein|nr:MAG: hypothetical protein A2Z39_02955 [Deltaproteobacteria bacterium RBG_19FT_COMBO_46_9]